MGGFSLPGCGSWFIYYLTLIDTYCSIVFYYKIELIRDGIELCEICTIIQKEAGSYEY